MTIRTPKTLEELLVEGATLVPIFSDPTCSSFKVGVYHNGIPHAVWNDIYERQEECQQVIDCFISQFKALRP